MRLKALFTIQGLVIFVVVLAATGAVAYAASLTMFRQDVDTTVHIGVAVEGDPDNMRVTLPGGEALPRLDFNVLTPPFSAFGRNPLTGNTASIELLITNNSAEPLNPDVYTAEQQSVGEFCLSDKEGGLCYDPGQPLIPPGGGLLVHLVFRADPGTSEGDHALTVRFVGTTGADVPPPSCVAAFESLNDGCPSVPSVAYFTVTTFLDLVDTNVGDGQCQTVNLDCSLRAAIQEANQLAPGLVTISLPRGTHELTIPAAGPVTCEPNVTCVVGGSENSTAIGDLDITGNVFILGRDRDETIISVLDSDVGRVFDVAAGAEVGIQNLTITNGYAPPWRLVDPSGDSIVLPFCENTIDCDGGGLRNYGDLHLSHIVVHANASNGNGNGVANSAYLLVTNSIISDNQDDLGHGGGIFSDTNFGYVLIERTTISGNSTDLGAGITNFAGDMTLTNVTVSGNMSGHLGAGVSGANIAVNASTIVDNQLNGTDGAGVFADGGTIQVKNSIIANTIGPSPGPNYNCLTNNGGIINSLGSNMEDGSTCGFALDNTDPLLDSLAGDPPTHALLPGSPAIDAVTDCNRHDGVAIPTDQREVSRPQPAGGACDIGAFEAQ